MKFDSLLVDINTSNLTWFNSQSISFNVMMMNTCSPDSLHVDPASNDRTQAEELPLDQHRKYGFVDIPGPVYGLSKSSVINN